MNARESHKLWIAWLLANTVSFSALGALLAFGNCAGPSVRVLAGLAIALSGGLLLGTAQYAALRFGHAQVRGWFWATFQG